MYVRVVVVVEVKCDGVAKDLHQATVTAVLPPPLTELMPTIRTWFIVTGHLPLI